MRIRIVISEIAVGVLSAILLRLCYEVFFV